MRQQVVAALGRVEDLRESGQLERLLRSGIARRKSHCRRGVRRRRGDDEFCAAHQTSAVVLTIVIVDKLPLCHLETLSTRYKDFALERAVLLLFCIACCGCLRSRGGSLRHEYRIEGVEDLDLHHLYRAMA